MWRRCCCNCQVDESDQRENGLVKATTNNIDGMFLSLYLDHLFLHAAVFEIPSSFDVIVSFSSGVTKGLKDSATGKVELHNAPPPIDIPVLSLDELIEKTDDFGSTSLIGEGSYGRVYYAILDNGIKMAVKKLDSTENEPTTEFLAQVGVVLDY